MVSKLLISEHTTINLYHICELCIHYYFYMTDVRTYVEARILARLIIFVLGF